MGDKPADCSVAGLSGGQRVLLIHSFSKCPTVRGCAQDRPFSWCFCALLFLTVRCSAPASHLFCGVDCGERFAVAKKHGPHRDKILSAIAVNKKPPGRHYDGAGLYLEVDEGGARRWGLRTVVHGRRRDIGLGSVKTVSLAEARDEASRLRKVARAGGDPLAERRTNAAPTFETAAGDCYAARSEAWRNAKHKAQWLSSLKAYAYPLIGKTRVDRIGTPEVMSVLTPIWLPKPATARRVRQRVGLVLDWAKAQGYRATGSPTREIGKALPAHKEVQSHFPAMPYGDVPAFLKAMQETGATDPTKAALEFLILTACRTNEVLGARWPEVNFDAQTWTIPGERTKSRKPHTVPLAPRTIAILKARKAAHSGRGEFVFEARLGERLSSMTLLTVLRRMEINAVVHGFRSSFRDWTAERTNAAREVAEACLAHVVKDKSERAYKRTEFLQKRKKLMDDWAAFCALGAKVIKFKRVAS